MRSCVLGVGRRVTSWPHMTPVTLGPSCPTRSQLPDLCSQSDACRLCDRKSYLPSWFLSSPPGEIFQGFMQRGGRSMISKALGPGRKMHEKLT